MKRELYDIADEEFITLLDRTESAFKDAKIPHMFVGGVATQAHLASYLCRIHGTTLRGLVASNDIRLQDYLRATDDVDIALRLDEPDEIKVAKKIFSVLDNIIGEGDHLSPSEEHIISMKLARRGHVKPQIQLALDDYAENPDEVVAFNLYRKPKDIKNDGVRAFEDRYYDKFMKGAVKLSIPYSDAKSVILTVKNPVDLVATKVAIGRPKDFGDVLALRKYGKLAKKSISDRAVGKVLFGEALRERWDAFKALEDSLGKQE